jgi:6-phosphogluconolactonase
MIAAERLFDSREGLAAALAGDVANALAQRVKSDGKACLAVSGGATPRLFFEALSRIDIPWDKISVTLVDERQVPESSERSNARLVRESLIQNLGAYAAFRPISGETKIDVAILGMGNDGHTASFFPGGDNLAKAIDPNGDQRITTMSAPGAGEPRLTFTLPALLEARLLCLHIEGQEKRDVLDVARGEGPAEAMPIRAFLRSPKPLTLYWCP